MAQTVPVPLARVQAHIEGEISGQVAVGDRNVQIGSIHGGVVTVNVAEDDRPQVRPRARPVSVLPRPFPGLLDREDALSAAHSALEAVEPVDVYGEPGVGKTSLLHHLAHHPPPPAYPDGIVHLSGRQTLEDLLQSLYDAFFESDVPHKASDAEIRTAFQDIQALVMLDDVGLSRDEVGALLDSAPRCGFVLAAAERHLWGQGRAVPLKGLPLGEGLALIERELGRPLGQQECTDAEALCAALDGLPLHILQAVAEAQESGRSLVELAGQLHAASQAAASQADASQVGAATGDAASTLTEQVLASLSEEEQQVVQALAALRGAPVSAEHLSALTELADAMPVLETLQKRSLAQAHSPRFSLTGALAQAVAERWDLEGVRERALDHFIGWAGQRTTGLLDDAEALIEVLRWAAEGTRWAKGLRLARAIEGAFALGRRWGAWRQVLEWMLQAARALGDRAATAYALHQLGTRALCLGDTAAAHANLEEALQIRHSLGDPAGADVTRYHLDHFWGTPSAGPSAEGTPAVGETAAATGAAGASLAVKIVAIALPLVLLAAGAVAAYRAWFQPAPAVQPTATLTRTPMPTDTSMPTPTEIPTQTSTPTASSTPTVSPTQTTTATPTASPTQTATGTPTETPTSPATRTPLPTATRTLAPTFTPAPTGPLSLDVMLTDRRCVSPWRWVATFRLLAQGGTGIYTYYRDEERAHGPASDSTTFYEGEFSTDGPAVGTFFVESGQERVAVKFYERPPACATPTPTLTFTPTPTVTPPPTSTPTPSPTPTITPTPDTVGPAISGVSISPEHEPGQSVYANRDLTVQCIAVDPSGIQQVVLHYWFDPLEGGVREGRAAMTPADERYVAVLGEFGEEGTLRYRVEAQDRAGNWTNSPIELREVTYGSSIDA